MFEKVYKLLAKNEYDIELMKEFNEEELILFFKFTRAYLGSYYISSLKNENITWLELLFKYNIAILYDFGNLIEKYSYMRRNYKDCDNIINILKEKVIDYILHDPEPHKILNMLIRKGVYYDFEKEFLTVRNKILDNFKTSAEKREYISQIFNYYPENIKGKNKSTIKSNYINSLLISQFKLFLNLLDFFGWDIDDKNWLDTIFKIYIISYGNKNEFCNDVTTEQKEKIWQYIQNFYKTGNFDNDILINVLKTFSYYIDEKKEKQIINKLKYGAYNERLLMTDYRKIKNYCKYQKNIDQLNVKLTVYDLKH